MFQVPGRVIGVDVGDPDLFLLEPLAETGGQQDHSIGGVRGVTLCAHPIRERVEPARQGTFAQLWTNKLTVFDMLHSELLSSLGVDWWSSDYVVQRSETCLEIQGGIEFARDKNLPEIVAKIMEPWTAERAGFAQPGDAAQLRKRLPKGVGADPLALFAQEECLGPRMRPMPVAV